MPSQFDAIVTNELHTPADESTSEDQQIHACNAVRFDTGAQDSAADSENTLTFNESENSTKTTGQYEIHMRQCI
jgi:hypothetical protein